MTNQGGYTVMTRALLAAHLISPPWLLARGSALGPLQTAMYWHSFKQPVQQLARVQLRAVHPETR